MKQGWVHYPPKPGNFGYYEYYIDGMSVVAFVAHWETDDGYNQTNDYYTLTGKEKSLVKSGGQYTIVILPDSPYAPDAEKVKQYLETLYLTGAIDAYV